jgi:cyclopropane fatty-acyl-phospholipid synthase-like methyltransferase
MEPAQIQQNRLYGDLAYLWPLISPVEEYAAEARCWRNVLRGRLGPGRHRVLELGVGGGHHLWHLTADFEATAVDLSEAMMRTRPTRPSRRSCST